MSKEVTCDICLNKIEGNREKLEIKHHFGKGAQLHLVLGPLNYPYDVCVLCQLTAIMAEARKFVEREE